MISLLEDFILRHADFNGIDFIKKIKNSIRKKYLMYKYFTIINNKRFTYTNGPETEN
jgi:hypothetical protein